MVRSVSRVFYLTLSAILVSIALGSCADAPPVAAPGSSDNYTDPPEVDSYPSAQPIIQKWIDDMDLTKIRSHAWDIWASITSDSSQEGFPVWETWYSGYEVFVLAANTEGRARRSFRDFEAPHQSIHAALETGIPIDQPERMTSFNRYTRSLADQIVLHKYNLKSTLENINASWTSKTPIEDRKILTSTGPVDPTQISLKPVFQFISSQEPTAVPYWAGVAPQYTTDLANPEPHTWRQAVVVDPSGKLRPGSTYSMSFNSEPSRELPVVSLEDFYSIKLTQSDADAFTSHSFGFGSGDDVGKANLTSKAALQEVVKEGNLALLTAMHVTSKEIPNWTWQTFWWSFDPQDALYGRGRPKSVQGAWAHYNMRTAYFMVQPPGKPGGEPLHSFNPYLETNLKGTVPGPISKSSDGSEAPLEIAWTGPSTNCMSCHRMAGYKTQGYQPDGFLSPADPALFGDGTKTDFLWSIPLRAYTPPTE